LVNATAGYCVADSGDVETGTDEENHDNDPDYYQERDAAGMTEAEISPEIDRTQPYVIDDEEFTNGFPQHEKVSLYYYKVDDVLAEENEEVVTDIDNTIGYDAMNQFDMQTTVWVRNEPLGIDYEVVSINKSYAETVAGFKAPMTPREVYLAKQKKREMESE
jgi:hypothetical protein